LVADSSTHLYSLIGSGALTGAALPKNALAWGETGFMVATVASAGTDRWFAILSAGEDGHRFPASLLHRLWASLTVRPPLL